ncbi:uncharacterized protein LOC116602153 [Nematostella vectensis]|uniref:uncharacterized protein LOC116602153 n=1 Tax=Nematostella vectensis TaxID=45351 RepID=UPI0020774B42|nr:uncharacterized protein LOC116602153 [Nematostella vectensis]
MRNICSSCQLPLIVHLTNIQRSAMFSLVRYAKYTLYLATFITAILILSDRNRQIKRSSNWESEVEIFLDKGGRVSDLMPSEFAPVESIPGYKKVPRATLGETGDYFDKEVFNITVAQAECDRDEGCKAFVYHREPSKPGQAFMKQTVGKPLKSNETDLYIKSKHVVLYLRGKYRNLYNMNVGRQ